MRVPMFRSLSAGLLGGSLVASGIGVGTTDAAAPSVEPAVGPPAGGARPDTAPATIGTYDSCFALFPFESKEDLAVIEVAVEAGSGVLPDPLPGVPTDIVPVVRIERAGTGPIECVPNLAWGSQAEMIDFVFNSQDVDEVLDDPDKLIPLPEGTHIAIPVEFFQPEPVDPEPAGPLVVDPTVTIRFEHDLGDDIIVSSDPTDISDAWVPLQELLFSAFEANEDSYVESALARVADVDPAAADLLSNFQIDSNIDSLCEVPSNDLAIMIAAIEEAFGFDFDGVPVPACEVVFIGAVFSVFSLAAVATIDDLQVVTVTLDGPAPTTTTTTTLPAATTTTVDPSLGVLPPTGSGPSPSAVLAALLMALGVSGLVVSRRRPTTH